GVSNFLMLPSFMGNGERRARASSVLAFVGMTDFLGQACKSYRATRARSAGYRSMENPARIRTAIDSGRTGDKVDYPDPAAAPLGTDEEAAGTRLSPDAVQQAMKKELEIGALARW